MDVPRIVLKPGREKSVLHRHPWIFSGAIARLEGDPGMGETVLVCDAQGERLGWAAYSPESQIRARMWSWNPDDEIGETFFRSRLEKALELRRLVVRPGETDALRLVFAESDGLPGLVVDRYGDLLVMQCLTAGAERWRDLFADLLVELTGFQNIYERSDVDVRRLEGLAERTGPVRGMPPEGRLQIEENGLQFCVDVRTGHKTGFYLDQRPNRARLRDLPGTRGPELLLPTPALFLSMPCPAGQRSVLSVDSSREALELGEENVRLNGFDPDRAEWLEGDVFQVLRGFRDQRRTFDLIVLDPPKFAQTAAQAERAARGYKDINLLAFKLLRPGGLLFTFSCSGGVSADLFQKIVAGAALDAGVDAEIIEHLAQGPDHPVALNFPEGRT